MKEISFKGDAFSFEVLAARVDVTDGADGVHAHFITELNGLSIRVPHTSPDYQRFKDALMLFTLAK